MTQSDVIELVQLAEVFCPVILMDLPLMTVVDLHGLLLWLRNQVRAKEGGK